MTGLASSGPRGSIVTVAVSAALVSAALVAAALVSGTSARAAKAPRRSPQSIAGLAAQQVIVTAIQPDSARVGEPVVLGITVRRPDARAVGFPALVPLADPLEQTGPVEQRTVTEEGEWRAYYRIVAWRAGEQRVRPFEVVVRSAGGERRLEVAPRPFYVASVLPADTTGLRLREARPLLRITGPSWAWLLLLALGTAVLLYWLWRRRAGVPAVGAPLTPYELTLESLRRLRSSWQEGRLSADELYDGLEGALRGYAEATRAWRPGTSLQALTNGNRALAAALAHSVLVRFARVVPSEDTPLASIDAGESWVRRDAGERERATGQEDSE